MEWFWSRMAIRSCGVLLSAAVCGAAADTHAAVTISSDTTQDMTCSSGVCAPTAADAVLNVTDLENLLSSGSVKVITTGSGVQAHDIDVVVALSWSDGSSLTLDAYRSVKVGQAIAVNGTGGVSLVTNDGGRGGTLSFISGGSLSFAGTANSLSIDGKAYVLANSIATLAADIANKPSGRFALSAGYDASQDGIYANSPIRGKLRGTVNGLGNAISNLTIDSGAPQLGLFAYSSTKGEIDSLLVTNASIAARARKYNTVSVAGILAALNYGTVFDSFASGVVTDTAKKADDLLYVGGLIGENVGTILDSGASAAVAANGRYLPVAFTGGLAATNSDLGTIKESYATGSAASDLSSGGLVAFNGAVIENCYAEGNITLSGSIMSYVGGLAGESDTSIDNSYSTGTPAGGGSSYIGGFVGYDDSGGGFSDDFWDTTTSGIKKSHGAGNIANDPGITGLTTQQLQSGLPAGFDPTIWAENPNVNNGLPYLIANPPQN